MKKDLGRCRLHLHLQTSMTSIPSSNTRADDASGSGSSDPSPCEDSLGTDFEKLSLTLHQNLQNLSLHNDAQEERHCEDAPPWFLNCIGKMEENLRQTIRQEVRQCLREMLTEHLSSQTSAENSSDRHQDSMPETSSSVRSKNVSATTSEPVHLGITCDHCEQAVSGIRFKCGNCVDFDLCEACENIPGVHQTDHVFLKIRRPTYMATCREKGERRKSLLRHLYPQFVQVTTQGGGNESYRCRKREKKVKRWLTHAENFFSGSGHPSADRCSHRVGLLSAGRSPGYLLGHAQSQSLHERHSVQAQSSVPPASKRCLTDVSPGATLIVQPGQEFEKQWLVRNDSGEAFSESFRLRFSWGSLVPQGHVEVSVPPLKPGETGTVGPVVFRAPQQEGLYHSHWLLVSHPGAKPFHWPYLSCPVRVSRQKESLQEENKEADTESAPVLNKPTTMESTEKLKLMHINELEGKTPQSTTGNNNNTTDPEETDDTASILSISSCESDDDYVKVQGPTQLGFSTTTLLTKKPPKSSGNHPESQATSSSSIDLLSDMPQFEEENGLRQTPLPGDSAPSPAPSTVAVESSLPNSTSRSSVGSLNERHFTAPSETMSTSGTTQGNTEVPIVNKNPTPAPQAQSQATPRPDPVSQPEVVIPVLPEGLVTGALTAAASVYNTARAIISTLQPPMDHQGPRENPSNQGPPGPLALLIEMGFHDRDLNQRLLVEKGGCLEDVIAELIRLRPDRSLNID